jgi:hypothetical protein
VTVSGVMLAAVPNAARPQLSPLLGYLSFLLVVVVMCFAIWLLVLTSRGADTGDDDGGGGERGGGPDGGGGAPPGPRPRPESEPDWWPEFERAFAAHVNARLTRSS